MYSWIRLQWRDHQRQPGEIISDVLGDPKMDRTLEETVSFIVNRSAVKDCAGATCNTTKPKLLTAYGVKCWACGGPAHGPNNDHRARSRSCEAIHMVLNVQLNVITKRHVASAPLAVPGITVTSHPGYASRLEPAKPHPRIVAQSRQPRLKTTTTLVVSLTSYALHQDIIDHLIVSVPRAPLLWPPRVTREQHQGGYTSGTPRIWWQMGGSPL